MRPRKVVLLFCENEDCRRELRFVLETWHRAVVCMNGLARAAGAVDCALVISNRVSGPAAAFDIAERDPELPLVVVMTRKNEHLCYPYHAKCLNPDAKMADVLEAIRIAVARKRGPKKSYRGLAEAAEAANQSCQLA